MPDFKIQAPSPSERKRFGGNVVRVVSDITFAPTTDAEQELRSRLPGDFEIRTSGEGYGVGAYVVCESPEEEREAGLSVVGEQGVTDLIDGLRRFLAVHSYIYYQLGKTVCSDATWDMKARMLAKLQQVFGVDAGTWESEAFEGFAGDTGYHLPRTEEVKEAAESVLEQDDDQ